MSTEIKTAGGFTDNPELAFTPPAAGGCCGAPATSAEAGHETASTCCGTAETAAAAGSCCDPGAKSKAVAAGAGCCG
jgi:hypothetical protein